jgi:hypothetical protein
VRRRAQQPRRDDELGRGDVPRLPREAARNAGPPVSPLPPAAARPLRPLAGARRVAARHLRERLRALRRGQGDLAQGRPVREREVLDVRPAWRAPRRPAVPEGARRRRALALRRAEHLKVWAGRTSTSRRPIPLHGPTTRRPRRRVLPRRCLVVHRRPRGPRRLTCCARLPTGWRRAPRAVTGLGLLHVNVAHGFVLYVGLAGLARARPR